MKPRFIPVIFVASTLTAAAQAPTSGNERLRAIFRMHGDNRTNDASQSCPIVPPATRQALVDMLNRGGQVRLEVRPSGGSGNSMPR